MSGWLFNFKPCPLPPRLTPVDRIGYIATEGCDSNGHVFFDNLAPIEDASNRLSAIGWYLSHKTQKEEKAMGKRENCFYETFVPGVDKSSLDDTGWFIATKFEFKTGSMKENSKLYHVVGPASLLTAFVQELKDLGYKVGIVGGGYESKQKLTSIFFPISEDKYPGELVARCEAINSDGSTVTYSNLAQSTTYVLPSDWNEALEAAEALLKPQAPEITVNDKKLVWHEDKNYFTVGCQDVTFFEFNQFYKVYSHWNNTNPKNKITSIHFSGYFIRDRQLQQIYDYIKSLAK